MKEYAILLARIGLSAVFLYSGFIKFLNWEDGLVEFSGLGLPAPTLMLGATILVQIGGGLMVLAGFAARLGALLLGGFTIAATVLAHGFWTLEGSAFQQQLTIFLEHMAIVGGFVLLAVHGPGPVSIDHRRRSPIST